MAGNRGGKKRLQRKVENPQQLLLLKSMWKSYQTGTIVMICATPPLRYNILLVVVE